jgi:serine/threonine-protein kinase
VAVDSAGNVYVTERTLGQVLKLPVGSNAQVELPFTGLEDPKGMAVDTAGNVYIIDNTPPSYGSYGRVLKLPAGSNAQVELPFTGLQAPDGVAVDSAGNVYITDGESGDISRVLKLPAR